MLKDQLHLLKLIFAKIYLIFQYFSSKFDVPELPKLHLKTSNTHNFWSIGPKNTIFVLPQSFFQGASSQKVSKNPKIYCIYNSLSKNELSHFGSLRTLGVNSNIYSYRMPSNSLMSIANHANLYIILNLRIMEICKNG
jgi:hypothetical protein